MAVVLGKALGGFFGDRYGYMKTSVVSLMISLVCFVFSFNYWLAGVVGLLCFNMTMPLTLTAIASVSNQKYGFSFGLTTFALAIGFIPTIFGADSWFSVRMLLISVSLSLSMMVLGYVLLLKSTKGGDKRCGF